jgi:hypothetical protein
MFDRCMLQQEPRSAELVLECGLRECADIVVRSRRSNTDQVDTLASAAVVICIKAVDSVDAEFKDTVRKNIEQLCSRLALA